MAKLILSDGSSSREVDLEGEMFIGRHPDNQIHIPEPQASRKHAKIFEEASEFVFEDLNSANGSLVNGDKAGRHILKHGDSIQIGQFRLVYENPNAKKVEENDYDALFAPTMMSDSQPEDDPLFAPTAFAPGADESAAAAPTPTPGTPPQVAAAPAPQFQTQPAPAPNAIPQQPQASPIPGGQPVQPIQPGAVHAQPGAPGPYQQPSSMVQAALATPQPQPQLLQTGQQTRTGSSMILKLMVLFLALLVLALGGVAIFLTLRPQGNIEEKFKEIQTAMEAEKFENAKAIGATIDAEALNDEQKKKLKKFLNTAEGHIKADELKKKFENAEDFKAIYEEAKKGQDAYPLVADRFVKLTQLTFDAGYVLKTHTHYEEAIKTEFDPQKLKDQIKPELENASKKFKKHQAQFEAIEKIAKAHKSILRLLDTVTNRIPDIILAKDSWTAAQNARKDKQWTSELKALKALTSCSDDVMKHVTKGQDGNKLFVNSTAFVNGLNALKANKLDEAQKEFKKIEEGDYHYALAQEKIKLSHQSDLLKQAKTLHRQGKSKEGLELVKDSKDPAVEAFKKRVSEKLTAFSKLSEFENSKDWAGLAKAAHYLLSMLDAQEDAYYHARTSSLIKAARTEQYKVLEELFNQQKYGPLLEQSETFLKQVTRIEYPKLVKATEEIRAKTIDTVKKSSQKWIQEAETNWKQYKQAPIEQKERVSEDNSTEIPESFQSKAKLLQKIFASMKTAKEAVMVLDEQEKHEIEKMYTMVVDEVILQSENLDTVKNAYQHINKDTLVKKAEDMILMLPEVPNNRFYSKVIDARKK